MTGVTSKREWFHGVIIQLMTCMLIKNITEIVSGRFKDKI